ncbi:MAG TPA: NAD(P)-dependent oxidoreductase [Planctomycetaceae bacterium]|nr:NAD(P)-dependent oxidoreductase [Planctomycetaceae bacterium]HIQ19969.1 NAD(P)-dependent oxidoreductase [Planctomycetota bacterium]
MVKLLITGGSGFFGTHLKRHLAQQNHQVVNFDLYEDPDDVRAGRMALGDLADPDHVARCFRDHGPFDAVIHAAAALAHGVRSSKRLWLSNVTGTRNLVEAAVQDGVRSVIFTSSNCLWGRPLNRPVVEDDVPCPVEDYGRSKLEAERLLRGYSNRLHVIIFRSPTILAAGRIGLLGILFDLILDGKRIPVVGRDKKPYQFISADDYARAIHLALDYHASDTFHVGSDHPTSLEEAYQEVIRRAGSRARLYHLPKVPTIALMKLLNRLRLSPLGPYHYRMIAEEFVFDTSHLKQTLGWRPTKTNGEILFEAFEYYRRYRHQLWANRRNLPAHRRRASMGVIDLLRWVS